MKEVLLSVIDEYLKVFPSEDKRQKTLIEYLKRHNDTEIIDWNNFSGHIVASSFIYAKEEKMFLMLYHKDLKMYLYPGGHVQPNDNDILSAAKREVLEETGLTVLEPSKICDDLLVPLDIDTHIIDYNERLNLPKHYHFDFRYLFTIERIEDIKIDTNELGSYQWIDMDTLSNNPHYGNITSKIKNLLNN